MDPLRDLLDGLRSAASGSKASEEGERDGEGGGEGEGEGEGESLTLDPMQFIAYKLWWTGSSFWFQGCGGCGKSRIIKECTDLSSFILWKKRNPTATVPRELHKCVTVLAPTGVAAELVDGRTIHSFLRMRDQEEYFAELPFCKSYLRLKPALREDLLAMDALVLDEASMIQLKLFRFLDLLLRVARESEAFLGGVQYAVFGDWYQLPPVASHYIFEDMYYRGVMMSGITLFSQFNHRSRDQCYQDFLVHLRMGKFRREYFDRIEVRPYGGSEDRRVFLYYENADVQSHNLRINDGGNCVVYEAVDSVRVGKNNSVPFTLKLKIGSLVMVTSNTKFRGVKNGSILRFVAESNGKLLLKTFVPPFVSVELSRMRFPLFGAKGKVVGSRLQFPVQSANAFTVNKAQGKTLPSVALDSLVGLGKPGYLYVVFSRVSRFEDITFTKRFTYNQLLSVTVKNVKSVDFVKEFLTDDRNNYYV